MKKALTVLLAGLLATAFVLPSLAETVADSNPEFYFTRLIYRLCYPAALTGPACRMGLNFIVYSMSHQS